MDLDPFEALDRAIGKPVAKGYVKVTPRVVRTGISNAFSNLDTVPTIINDALQGKFKQVGHDSARFLLNSTLGLGGLFDPASAAGLEYNDEDLGQTLGKWGVKSGPYLMLPVLGPSSLRDAFSRAADTFMEPVWYLEDDSTRYLIRLVDLLDQRASLLELDAQLERSYDKYAFVRNAWLQRREYQVKDGNVDESLELEEEIQDEPEAAPAPETTPAPESEPAAAPADPASPVPLPKDADVLPAGSEDVAADVVRHRYLFRLDRLDRSLRYRLEVAGTQSAWFSAHVIREVRLTGLTLSVVPPTYLREPTKQLRLTAADIGKSPVAVPEGSVVELTASLDTPVEGAVLQAAMDGQGVALARSVIAAADLREGRLIRPLPFACTTSYSYHLLYPTGMPLSRAASAFCHWLKQEAERFRTEDAKAR